MPLSSQQASIRTLGQLLTIAIASSVSAQSWTQVPTAHAPSPRNSAGCAFDIARGRFVQFGGWDLSHLGDTWEYDGLDWQQRTPAHTPVPRSLPRMVYDQYRMRTILYGGHVPGIGWTNETWEWDGNDWMQLTPQHAPPPLGFGSMAYDSIRRRIVLFGGSDLAGTCYGETWEWNGVDWVQMQPAVSPSPRRDAAITFDSIRGQVVLFGGGDNNGSVYGDTWTWDGTNWTQLNPAASPPARWGMHMVFDSLGGKAIFYGGVDAAATVYYDETWMWDGTTWSQASAGPSGRRGGGMVYDSRRAVVVMQGGMDSTQFYSETWAFSNQAAMPAPNVALWHGEGDLLDSVGGHHGTASSPGLTFGPGVSGQALLFNGSTRLEVPDSPAWDFGVADFSIEMWVNLSRIDNSPGLIAHNDGSGPHNKWSLIRNYLGANNLTFHMNFSSSITDLVAPWQPTANVWQHYVLSRSGATWSFFLDGVLVHSATFSGAVPNASSPLVIGQSGEGSGGIQGGLDEVAIYNHSLTAAEVRYLYYAHGTRCCLAQASFSTYGIGCASSVGIPNLAAAPGSLPRLGNTFTVRFSNLPSFLNLVVPIYGFSNTLWNTMTLPQDLWIIGMPGCTQYVEPASNAILLNTVGTLDWNMAVPSNPALVSIPLYMQALVFDPAMTNAARAAATNAGIATLGW